MQAKVIIFLLFALVIAVLAVTNIQPVMVNYVFGQTEIPLIFVVIFSVLFGALALFVLSSMKQLQLQRKIKLLEKENGQIKEQLEEYYKSKKENLEGAQAEQSEVKEEVRAEQAKEAEEAEEERKHQEQDSHQ